METSFNSANEAFKSLFEYIIEYGPEKSGTKFTKNVSFTILKAEDNVIKEEWRKWDKSYADLEYDWYKTGNRNPEMVEKRAKIWGQIKDDSGYVNSNYGNWWHKNMQYARMLMLLAKNPDTRRAVLVHYDVDDVDNYQKDTPCNIVLNFHVSDRTLYMTIFARSIDLVYGFCNDQYCFSRLQIDTAKLLGLYVGSSHYFITDLHIYEKHYKMNERVNYNSI